MSLSDTHLRKAILGLVPADGSTMGNGKLHQKLSDQLGEVAEEDFWRVRETLIQEGILCKGKGRGGSVFRTEESAPEAGVGDARPDLHLQMQDQSGNESPTTKRKAAPVSGKRKNKGSQAQVLSYRYDEKRKNNPHVGMVDTASDGVEEKNTWRYDPHLDPELRFDSSAIRTQIENLIDDALASGDHEQMKSALEELKRLQSPYLQWTGKAERTSFEVDTVSLHVHERVDPATVLAAVQKKMKANKAGGGAFQPDMFHAPFENLPLREAIDFYKHERDWANRLIAGDSLLVMNSMLQKEGMAGQVQMVYIDPPYGISYGSNFQPFTDKRNVTDRKDEDLTQEPEMIKAFRDTWELGIHSYLTYLRDRILLAKELLSESGSIFVQISDENVHYVRNLMDEICGSENFICEILVQKTGGQNGDFIVPNTDILVWYAKSKKAASTKYNQLYIGKTDSEGFSANPLTSDGYRETTTVDVSLRGEIFSPGSNNHWKVLPEKIERLEKAGRIIQQRKQIRFKQYASDFPAKALGQIWGDRGGARDKIYVVQTASGVVERCLLMATDPGDLVLDPTCGSGTTACVAEKWGRRWITCDTSRVAVSLAKKRLISSSFDYYQLKYPQEGLSGGFEYKTVPHVTLSDVASNTEVDEIHKKMIPAVTGALSKLNSLLRGKSIEYVIGTGGRKGLELDFSVSGGKKMTLASGDRVYVNELLEWEVPHQTPEDWPEDAKIAVNEFKLAQEQRQREIDESVASQATQEVLYDQPIISKDKLRITGPFTVEAVPFATVLGLDEAEQPKEADFAVARSGATSRHAQWRGELLKAGIRGKGGQTLKLTDLEALPEMKYLHAVGTVADTGERVAISFGPEYAALEQRQAEIAKQEAGDLFPVPKLLVFCAFTFDPEAAKDIDSIRGIQALKVHMNTDLLTEDLKKNARSNESFWLMGQPDVQVHDVKEGKLQVEVHGFDYFDTKTGELKSGGKKDIAMWELDTDYDDRSLYPRQVFFPMAGKKDGWYKLKKDIRAELNEDLLDKFHGTRSLPFEPGDNRCLAVKIIDNRGIESLKVIRLD